MIQDNTLQTAIKEAERFIDAAKALQTLRNRPPVVTSWGSFPPSEAREHAACRRASMDLTRKLADLRQGR